MNRVIADPHVSYWRRALAWAARPRHAYAILVVVGAGVFDLGVGQIYGPLALILGGAGGAGLGLVGLSSSRSRR